MNWMLSGLLLGVFLLPIGCGDGSSSTSSSSADSPATPLTKVQFIKQANAICEEGLKKKDEAVRQSLEKSAQMAISEAEAGKAASEAALPVFSKMIEELGELGAVPKEEVAVSRILEKYEAALKKAEADPRLLVATNPFVPADKAATAYGLKACNA